MGPGRVGRAGEAGVRKTDKRPRAPPLGAGAALRGSLASAALFPAPEDPPRLRKKEPSMAAWWLAAWLLGLAAGSCFTGPASISVNNQRKNIQVSIGISAEPSDCEGAPADVLFTLFAGGSQASATVEGFAPNEEPGTLSGITDRGEAAGVVNMTLGSATRVYNVTLSCVDGTTCVELMKATVSGRIVVSSLDSDEGSAFSETIFISYVQTQNYDYSGCYDRSAFIISLPHQDPNDKDPMKYMRDASICVEVSPLACEFPFDSLNSFKAAVDIVDPMSDHSTVVGVDPLYPASEYHKPGAFSIPYDHTAVTTFCYYCGLLPNETEIQRCRKGFGALLLWPYKFIQLRLDSTSFGQGSQTAVGVSHVVESYQGQTYRNCLTNIRLLAYKDRVAITFVQTLEPECVIPENTISMQVSMNYYTDPDPGRSEEFYYIIRDDKMFSFSETETRVWFYCRTDKCQQQLNNLIAWNGDVYGEFGIYFNDWQGDLIDAVYTDITTFQQSCALEAKVYIYGDRICFVTQPSYASYCAFNQDPEQERDIVLELYRNEYPDFEQYALHTMARFERRALYTGETKEICFSCKEHYISASYEGGSECTSQLRRYFEEYRTTYVVSKLEVLGTDILGDKVLFYNYTDLYITYGVLLAVCVIIAVTYFVISIFQIRRFVREEKIREAQEQTDEELNGAGAGGSGYPDDEEVEVEQLTGRIGEVAGDGQVDGQVDWPAASFSGGDRSRAVDSEGSPAS